MATKKYGLIIPNKSKQNLAAQRPVIAAPWNNDESDESEGEEGPVPPPGTGTRPKPGPQLPPSSIFSAGLKKKTQLEVEKALAEDPTVFDYDRVYDEMKESRSGAAAGKSSGEAKKNRAPKYVGNLLKQAEERKREDDRRNERKIQKEREEEGDEFADKEAFVTSAYKEKLAQLAEEAEKERIQKLKEDADDVTKKQDLTGFYRNILEERTKTFTAPTHNPPAPESGAETLEKFKDKKSAKNLRQRNRSENEPEDEDELPQPKSSRLNSDSEQNDDDYDHMRRRSDSGSPKRRGRSRTPTPPLAPHVLKSQKSTKRRSPSPDDSKRLRRRRRSSGRKSRRRSASRSPHHRSSSRKENSSPSLAAQGPPAELPPEIPILTRRERILKILAKRTIGSALEDAKARYEARKAFLQEQGLKLYQIATIPDFRPKKTEEEPEPQEGPSSENNPTLAD